MNIWEKTRKYCLDDFERFYNAVNVIISAAFEGFRLLVHKTCAY